VDKRTGHNLSGCFQRPRGARQRPGGWALAGLGLVIAVLLLAGCAARASQPETRQPFDPEMSVHELMEWILNPAAEVIWDSAGTIITAEGHEELAPTTDAGWHDVERAAATLSEAGNLLMLPGRAAGDDWIGYAQALVGAGRLAREAAGAQDADALFDAGGHLYQVCRGCHDQYWVQDDPQG